MTSIQVAIRLRPLLSGESGANNMEYHSETKRILFGPKTFDCDHLLSPDYSQDKVFQQCCRPTLDSIRDGSQGTIMVYGQTGTGKTHTIFGSDPKKMDGIFFLCVSHLLERIQDSPSTLSVSVVEVYMEKVTDLQTGKEIPVYHGAARNLTWSIICSLQQSADIIFGALRSRHVASTSMNERSSRSHVIVNMKILRRKSVEVSDEDLADEAEITLNESHLALVDLAGSECVGKSKAQGKTMQEASSINRSLLALKKIILDLSSPNPPSHISYRDSKLTELLQDSIGGFSRTLLIACVSSSSRDIEETKSTLEYATKARLIKNLVNSEKEKLQLKIKGLQYELQKAKNKLEIQANERGHVVITKSEYDDLLRRGSRIEELEEALKDALQSAEKRLNVVEFNQGLMKKLRESLRLKDEEISNLHARVSGVEHRLLPLFENCTNRLENLLCEEADAVNEKVAQMHSSYISHAPELSPQWDLLETKFSSVLAEFRDNINEQFTDIRNTVQGVIKAAPSAVDVQEYRDIIPELRRSAERTLELLSTVDKRGDMLHAVTNEMQQYAETSHSHILASQAAIREDRSERILVPCVRKMLKDCQDEYFAHVNQDSLKLQEREFSFTGLRETMHEFHAQAVEITNEECNPEKRARLPHGSARDTTSSSRSTLRRDIYARETDSQKGCSVKESRAASVQPSSSVTNTEHTTPRAASASYELPSLKDKSWNRKRPLTNATNKTVLKK